MVKSKIKKLKCQWCGRIGTRNYGMWNDKPQCIYEGKCVKRCNKNLKKKVKKQLKEHWGIG